MHLNNQAPKHSAKRTEQRTQTASNKNEIVFDNNADPKKSPKPKRQKP